MSTDDKYRAVVAMLRSAGATVDEAPGCYGRQRPGGGWTYGDPVAQVNHHFVISVTAPEGEIVAGIQSNDSTAAPPPRANWTVSALGRITLVATGVANHCGTGRSEVLALVRGDQPPHGPAAMVYGQGDNYDGGNDCYDGTETQHPGDASPYPDALINALVMLNAAKAIVFGWTANRSIHHYEHSFRKIDMSWLGGPTSLVGGQTLRARVAMAIGSKLNHPTDQDGIDMASLDDLRAIVAANNDVLAGKVAAKLAVDPVFLAALDQKIWGHPLPTTDASDTTALRGAGRVLSQVYIRQPVARP